MGAGLVVVAGIMNGSTAACGTFRPNWP